MGQIESADSHRSGWQASLKTAGCLALAVLLLLLAAYFSSGKVGLEKSVTRLVLPAGAIWLGLSWLTVDALVRARRSAGACILAAWLSYTLISTAPLSDWLMQRLESEYAPFQPGLDQDLDLLIVLGGGTNQGPQRAQAGMAGDRILLAAQLYLSGHVGRLVTTGDSIPGINGKISGPREQTREIWLGLGIPEGDIEQLEGVNTFAEMQSIKAMEERLKGKRVGLLTSANHLPRAMRLAKTAGVNDLIPIPADFQSRAGSYAVFDLIPNVWAIEKFSRWQHEVMGRIIGR